MPSNLCSESLRQSSRETRKLNSIDSFILSLCFVVLTPALRSISLYRAAPTVKRSTNLSKPYLPRCGSSAIEYSTQLHPTRYQKPGIWHGSKQAEFLHPSRRPKNIKSDKEYFLYNWRLSTGRAASVLYEFKHSGLEPTVDNEYNLSAVGKADSDPLCNQPTDECYRMNRRTTLRLQVDTRKLPALLNHPQN